VITIRTTDFSSGIMRLTAEDGAIIKGVISEFVNRLGRMEKRVYRAAKGFGERNGKTKNY